jgi:hypothetical protein
MVTGVKSNSSAKTAAKRKPADKSPVRNFVEVSPLPYGLDEIVKSIVSGCFGSPVEPKRAAAEPSISDAFATNLGRIAEKLMRTDERIDKLSAAVEQLLNYGGISAPADVPHRGNDQCIGACPGDKHRSENSMLTPVKVNPVSIDDSMKILWNIVTSISDYVQLHKDRYDRVLNQTSKADIQIEPTPPATCELQATIHSMIHSLSTSNAELREMASRCLA